MAALPADIAKFTADGVVVTSPTNPAVSAAILAADPKAKDTGDGDIETFFDTIADAQAMLDERFAILSQIGAPHEGIEVEERLGIGTSIAIAPAVPMFRIVDEERGMDRNVRLRAFVSEMGTDRFSVEVLG